MHHEEDAAALLTDPSAFAQPDPGIELSHGRTQILNAADINMSLASAIYDLCDIPEVSALDTSDLLDDATRHCSAIADLLRKVRVLARRDLG